MRPRSAPAVLCNPLEVIGDFRMYANQYLSIPCCKGVGDEEMAIKPQGPRIYMFPFVISESFDRSEFSDTARCYVIAETTAFSKNCI